MVPWAHQSSQPKRHVDWFSRFAELTSVTDRQTDHASRSITVGRIYVHSTAMRPKINSTRHRASADISHSALCCHSNETRASVANSPNSAQLEGTPYHCPSYIRLRTVVWEFGEGQTDTQTSVTNIHFASATPHAKCNQSIRHHCHYNVSDPMHGFPKHSYLTEKSLF